jgi:glycerate kinase
MGKAPGHVINMARECCIPVIAICGAITPDISPSTIGLIAAIAVSDGLSIEQAMDTAGTLMRVGAAVRQAVTKVADSL